MCAASTASSTGGCGRTPVDATHRGGVGQAERMVRTIKEATVKAFHYETQAALAAHVLAFVAARNFGKHLKALLWRTPWEAVRDAWTRNPEPFKVDPHHFIPGPYRVTIGECCTYVVPPKS